MIRKMTLVGLMSGTSLDGIDAALVDLWEQDTRTVHRLREFLTLPMPEELQAALLECQRKATLAELARLDMQLGVVLAEAALAVLAKAGTKATEIAAIASHGQTVWHEPGKASLQIGNASVIAERTGITVISDFRPGDIAAGGQGAPLVPFADQELYGQPDRRLALLNIGGIANLTSLEGGKVELAFDTGPGNMVIDALCRKLWNESYDRDGTRAEGGRIDQALLRELSGHPFFALKPPRSTGREEFGDSYVAHLLGRASALRIPPEDLVATATALTAFSIGDSLKQLPGKPEELLVSGGGVHNLHLLRLLGKVAGEIPIRVLPDADAKEAIAFALLGYRTLGGKPNTIPAATGASHPVISGRITPGRNFSRIVELPLQAPLEEVVTEGSHPGSASLDMLSGVDLAALMAEEEFVVAQAVALQAPRIGKAIDLAAERLARGGRLIYVGAGTSGRLGVLDAAECPPTFSTPAGMVIGLMAGGDRALTTAVEGAEDDAAAGTRDLDALSPGPEDVVVGLSASGGAPYVHGALIAAHTAGSATMLVTCNPGREAPYINLVIAPVVGPEVLSGSTRMKAGTATKVVLNMLSTGTMVRLGKVLGNRMVDVHVSNRKLRQRAARILADLAGTAEASVDELLAAAGGSVKVAIAMERLRVDAATARNLLAESRGFLRKVLEPGPASVKP